MRKIEVKTYELKNPEGNFVTTKDLVINCLNYIPQEGITMSEVIKRDQLINLFENEEIELNDQDVLYIKQLVRNSKWGVINKDIVDFGLYIQSL